MKIKRFLVFTAIGIITALTSVLFYALRLDILNSIDLKLKDVRFRTRGNVVPHSRVVIVAIDEKSINELGRWPWDRRVMAGLIENLALYGAKTTGLDIVFSEVSTPPSDRALSEAIRKSKNVILGYFFRGEGETPPKESLKYLEENRIKIIKTEGDIEEIPVYSYPQVELNVPGIGSAGSGMGFFNIIPDHDGILRSINLLMLYDGYLYPSLSLSVLKHYLGSEIVVVIKNYGVESLMIGDLQIPCDESGRFTINYYGRQGSVKTISAVDVLKGRISGDELRDSIVFIGAVEVPPCEHRRRAESVAGAQRENGLHGRPCPPGAVETGIADVRATPLDPVLPGVEAHATIVSNILEGRLLIRDGRVMALDIFFIVFFAILLTTILSFMRKTIYGLVGFIFIIILYYSINLYLFSHHNLNTSVLHPFISIILSYISSEAYRNLVEEKESRFLKKAFSSYVSPELVSEIIRNPHLLKLGGEKRVVTILFSDIRDFTTISEKLLPETLVSLLNRYLSPMTEIVLKYRGMLDKYIGDAIMAIYNAPVTLEKHAFSAINTSIEMMDRLRDINSILKNEGLPEIDTGIGINTGECVVGNVGTQVRFDYTAIGDAVNLASRLEGLNKIYKTNIILSEYTLEELEREGYLKKEPYQIDSVDGRRVYFRELDYIRVKGKSKPVRIFELMVKGDPELIMRFERALGLYRSGRFVEAIEIFGGISGDGPSMVYISRCEYFIEHPPQDRWDGVFTARDK